MQGNVLRLRPCNFLLPATALQLARVPSSSLPQPIGAAPAPLRPCPPPRSPHLVAAAVPARALQRLGRPRVVERAREQLVAQRLTHAGRAVCRDDERLARPLRRKVMADRVRQLPDGEALADDLRRQVGLGAGAGAGHKCDVACRGWGGTGRGRGRARRRGGRAKGLRPRWWLQACAAVRAGPWPGPPLFLRAWACPALDYALATSHATRLPSAATPTAAGNITAGGAAPAAGQSGPTTCFYGYFTERCHSGGGVWGDPADPHPTGAFSSKQLDSRTDTVHRTQLGNLKK
jgi:hypothetical protein